MAADEGKMKIEKFDGADFGFWKMQIEDYLYQKKLYQPLSENKPEGMNDEDWTLLDRQALGVIRLTLSRNVAFNIAKKRPRQVSWRLFPVCMRNHQPLTKFT
ncbi:hypothetical protein Prudu_007647 [Prunus dulcis]|uniref:Retrovirus-related Pol polyprotein from transposon TNT 1-94 n=1 Tax=Prunus dulcis TaxID=3755 RepID=A0A4Y1QV92_PRUDU|nr:hypothetical protein Prudu_004434 [Prunus dulcis]BBG98287.1 hypothetical protein Prudu_007647 [Prunus dulcis]